MSFLFCKKEPPLHLAVIKDDIVAVKKLLPNETLQHERNKLGFTALEIAKLLDRKQCIALLDPDSPPRLIQVLPKLFFGESTLVKWDENKFKDYFGVEYRSHLRFADYSMLKSVIKNCPWILSTSRWGEEHRQLAETYRDQIDKGSVADIAIRWIDDKFGYGLFAMQDLPPETYVGEYTGLVRSLSRFRPDTNAYCFQYPKKFLSWNYYIIDAFAEGNETRFINHSDEPNLQPSCLVDRGLSHLVFFTNQAIAAGEQLTFNYGPDYWRRRKK